MLLCHGQARRLPYFWLLALIMGVLFRAPAASGGDFVAGADFSHLGFFEARGIAYRDGGEAQDGLAILGAMV